jgi:hypothetical protein
MPRGLRGQERGAGWKKPDGSAKQQKRGHYAKADDADPIGGSSMSHRKSNRRQNMTIGPSDAGSVLGERLQHQSVLTYGIISVSLLRIWISQPNGFIDGARDNRHRAERI